MITVIIFNLFVVYFAYIAKVTKNNKWLKLSFVLIFLFLALRYDYGNDYMGYLDGFYKVKYIDLSSRYELGWQILCLLFKPLGFFAMITFLAAINCIIYYGFIKKYVPVKYYWLAVFIYLYNPTFLLVPSSAMRQSIAIGFFLFSLDYLYKKDAVRYVLSVIIAAMFHTSALILLPLYMIYVIDWKITKIKAIILFTSFLFMIMFAKIFESFIQNIIGSYFYKYEVYQYQGGTELQSGLGLIYVIVIFIIILFYSRFQTDKSEYLFKIAVVSYFILPLAFLINLIGRISMYTQPVMIAVVPLILISIKDKVIRRVFLSTYLFMILYSFYIFFNSETWSYAFAEYKTIFAAPEMY
jgi:transmembrane protein EpsG